jgi:hypothetical protein
VALALELALEDDEDGPAEVEVEVIAEEDAGNEELLTPDEVEGSEALTTLAPQTEGTFAAGPTLDLR